MNISPHQDLKSLVGKLSQELIAAQKKAEHDLLQPIPVISPSMAFSDWVQVEIAENAGLCMGFEFLMSGDFLERFYAAAFGSAKENPWSKSALTWELLPFIADYAGTLGIQNPTSRDCLALAGLIADQFDQYAHYRPDLIERWNGNDVAEPASKDEQWQREIWRKVKGRIGEKPSVVRLKELEEKLFSLGAGNDIRNDVATKEDGDIRNDVPPSDVLKKVFPVLFVVGTGTLDPLLVRILRILEKAGCEVQVYVSLPSLGYLDDLKRSGSKIAEDSDPESVEMSDGHALLVSMGRKAIGTFRLLGELDEQYTGWPEADTGEPPGLTVLNRIQSDIRNLNESGPKLEKHDLSLRVHSCFGARREMEVLRDELLRAFSDPDIPNLQPHEVLIVTPSLATYAPLVSAVLEQGVGGGNEFSRLEARWPRQAGSLSSEEHLSIRLTELPPSEQSAMAEGILAFLEMTHHGGFEASALIELLHLRAVRSSLGIADDAEALDKLRGWVIQSGLTRGLGENEAEPGSWQFASDRLVAGSWFGAEERFSYPDWTSGMMSPPQFVLSIADELGGHRELRERFLEWLGELSACLKEWKIQAGPRDWSLRFGEAAQKLLLPKSGGDEEVHLTIQKQLTFLEDTACDVLVDAGAMWDWLEAEFEQSAKRSVMTGQIALGGFKHLQHIPCRVLAMVGMQDGQFPRQNRVPSWSLLRLKPKVWDRNARIEDRQLFLDAVLTPTDRLIITASSRNIRSGKSEPFSVCVDELLRVAEGVCAPKEKSVVEHPLQPFSPAYFEKESGLPGSFDLRSKTVSEALIETAKNEQAGTARHGIPFWVEVGEAPTDQEIKEITLAELIAFWKDPAKGYIKALGIQTHEEESNDEDLDRTPLQLDKLQEWKVKDVVMNDLLGENGNADFSRAKILANRGLPPCKLGDDIWSDLKQTAEPIGKTVREIAGGGALGGDIVPDVVCSGVQLMDAAPGGDIVPDVLCGSAQLMDAAPGGDIVPDVLCGSAQLMDAAPGGDIVPDVVCSSAQLMDAGNVVPTSLRPTSFVPTVGVKCEVSTVLIRGEVQVGIYQGEKVLLGYRVGKIESAKHYLEPWICAVAKAAGGQGMRTCLIAENHVPTPLILDAIEPEEAATILGCLVQGFLEGRLRPLCYAPGTSDEYVKRITSTTRPKTPEEALGAMADQWNAVGRNGSPDGEGRSKTAMLAWRDQEAFAVRYHEAWKNWAEQIGKPLRSWFNP